MYYVGAYCSLFIFIAIVLFFLFFLISFADYNSYIHYHCAYIVIISVSLFLCFLVVIITSIHNMKETGIEHSADVMGL